MLAKRELSRLWEDTSKAPYKALFNPSVTATHVWTAVEVMRKVDRVLDGVKAQLDTSDRTLVVHGNRFILWAVMDRIDVGSVKAESDFTIPFDEAEIGSVTELTVQEMIKLVRENFADSYPQPLFKNQTKCRKLGALIAEALNDKQ